VGSGDVALTEANLWSMWSAFGRGDGCTLVDTPEVLRFETPLPHVPYNTVLRFQVDDDIDATIDSTLDAYTSRDVPLLWVVHPSARPSDLGERLEVRGLVCEEVAPGMVADLDALPAPGETPADVEITEITPAAHDPLIDLIAHRYSLPPGVEPTLRSILAAEGFAEPGARTRAWVAQRDGLILSKVILHLHPDAAGIYGVATRTEARGMGLARALTIRALEAAVATGQRRAVLHSTPMARQLYESLGFRAVCDFRLYSTPGTVHL
jgi:GNAT superfamily N-acetyltransferase